NSENVNSDTLVDGAGGVASSIETPTLEETSTDAALPESAASIRLERSGDRPPKKPLWPISLLIMFAVAGIAGWRAVQVLTSSSAGDTEETPTVEVRLPVRVVRARSGLAQGWVFDEGSVWPVRRRALNFQANGDITFVAKVNGVELKEGDFVSRGQLLASIDDRRQTASIETSESDIQVAETQRSQSDASLLKAEAGLKQAESDLALAKTERGRYVELFEQGAVSESDLDVYQNRVIQAEAALESAQQDIRSAKDGVESSDASIDAARARLNQAAVDLEDTKLISPIDGVVAYINIREGEYWSTQYLDTSSPQRFIETAPIVVMNPNSFEVELEIQADEAGAIRVGQPAYVVLEEEVSAAQAAGALRQDLLEIARERGSAGRVFAVSPSQTPGSRGTRVVIRDLANTSNLKVGGRAYAWIEVAARNNAVLLPLGAFLSRDGQSYAFVVDETNGNVERRLVEPGIEGLSGIEVQSGVNPGDLVVVEGQNRLVEGTPVEIVNREDVS
ncbi:MAG: TolC family protein, partial [Cyanobacteria bacterium J06642_2]